jgi:hypothetical protein
MGGSYLRVGGATVGYMDVLKELYGFERDLVNLARKTADARPRG